MDKQRSDIERRRPFTTSQLINRQIRQLAVLVILILTAVAILAWSTNQNIDKGVQEVLNVSLEKRIEQVSDTLFKKSPYLVPDTAYLIKLNDLFFTGDLTYSNDDLFKMQQDILINITKGTQYDISRLQSTYLMLEDEEAPYVISNGQIVSKSAMQDTAWMDTCRRMRQDIWVEWRSIPLSYLHSVPVISVYRKITSVHWASDHETVGY